jgi:hypothetical protein
MELGVLSLEPEAKPAIDPLLLDFDLRHLNLHLIILKGQGNRRYYKNESSRG